MRCGLYYTGQHVVKLGIEENLVEFDFEKMNITKKIKTKDFVLCIKNVNDDTFLTGEDNGCIELINTKNLSYLSHLKLKRVQNIS